MFENMSEKNVYMGCGPDIREGFIHSDLRKFDHVDIVCNAWELSQHIKDVNHIYSRHMLEHLTNFEADRTLRDWLKALKTNGTIRIIVPDMDFHAKQWLEADWNEETLKNKWSDARHSFAGFWGWQEQCDPWDMEYNNSYWSVHKSGYNKKRMEFLLKRIGYINIEIETKNQWHLVVTATKPLGGGERQDATKLEDVRMDHRKRYEFATGFITKENAIVTDGACGVAYGSYILAQNPNVKELQAIDISQEAIDHGKKYFPNDKISYFLSNLEDAPIPTQSPDYFISFETIEHLPSPEKYIEKIAQNIKKDGVFIGSTPNETIMPYTKYFSYHTRHFTVDDLKEILTKYGFNDVQFYQQKRDEPSEIEKVEDGQYIIFVAKR
jgi:predicted SAM-dependent methyltransferase/2-polyprenyl-3-methyl-5-hydroxy-6-metoxy-1,4-benzoquinol methylase